MRFRTTSGLDSAVDPIQMKNVTFEHVKGVEEAKNELQDVVEFLRNPQKFTVLGGKLPKGIVFVLLTTCTISLVFIVQQIGLVPYQFFVVMLLFYHNYFPLLSLQGSSLLVHQAQERPC